MAEPSKTNIPPEAHDLLKDDFELTSALITDALTEMPDELRAYYAWIMDGNLELLSCLESADPDWHFTGDSADLIEHLGKTLDVIRGAQAVFTEEAGKFRRADLTTAMKAEADKSLYQWICADRQTENERQSSLLAPLILLDLTVWERLDSFLPIYGRRLDASYFRELLPAADASTVERFVMLRRDTSLLLECMMLAGGTDYDLATPFTAGFVRRFTFQDFRLAYMRINSKARSQIAFVITGILDVAVRKAGGLPALVDAVKQDVFTRRQFLIKYLKCTPDLLYLLAPDKRSFKYKTVNCDGLEDAFAQAAKAVAKPFAVPVAATLDLFLSLVSSAYGEDLDTLVPRLVKDPSLTQAGRLALEAGFLLGRNLVGVLHSEKLIGSAEFANVYIPSDLSAAMDRIPVYDYTKLWTDIRSRLTESDAQRLALHLQTALTVIEGLGVYKPSLKLLSEDFNDEEVSFMERGLGFFKGLALSAVTKPAPFETGMGVYQRFERPHIIEKSMTHRFSVDVAAAVEGSIESNIEGAFFVKAYMVTLAYLCSQVYERAVKGEFSSKFNRRVAEGPFNDAINSVLALTKFFTGPDNPDNQACSEAADDAAKETDQNADTGCAALGQ